MKALLTEKETADLIKISSRTLQRMRKEGTSPLYVRVGRRRIAYRAHCLEKWLRDNSFTSLAQEYSLAS